MTTNKRCDPQANKGNAMLDKETAHTIGAVAIALMSAMPDDSYNAADETLDRRAANESSSNNKLELFGSLVHVLTTPVAQLAEENAECERRKRKFTVINGGSAA